jgi:hypothetical protein
MGRTVVPGWSESGLPTGKGSDAGVSYADVQQKGAATK